MNDTLMIIGAVVIGIATVGIAIRIRKTRKDSSKVVQKGNVVGGDQAGRDIHK